MKLSAGVLPMQTRPADLAAIVREGVGAAGLGDDRPVDLELDDVTIEGDRTQLVEVVRQVVQNAGDVLARRGADRGLGRAARATTRSSTVTDHGPGIPEDEREHVFTTFPNWRPPGYEEVPGTGLGLFISQGPGRRTRRSRYPSRTRPAGVPCSASGCR